MYSGLHVVSPFSVCLFASRARLPALLAPGTTTELGVCHLAGDPAFDGPAASVRTPPHSAPQHCRSPIIHHLVCLSLFSHGRRRHARRAKAPPGVSPPYLGTALTAGASAAGGSRCADHLNTADPWWLATIPKLARHASDVVSCLVLAGLADSSAPVDGMRVHQEPTGAAQ